MAEALGFWTASRSSDSPPLPRQIALNQGGCALAASGEIQRLDVKLSPGLVPPAAAFFALPAAAGATGGGATLGRALDPLVSGAASAVRSARATAEAHLTAALTAER